MSHSMIMIMTGWWWLEPWNFEWLSHHIGNGIVIPTGELIFFRGVGKAPTRWQWDDHRDVVMTMRSWWFPTHLSWIDIDLGKFHHDRTLFSRALEIMVRILGESSPNGYGSIPIHTIFRGMNIHKSQLFWCELQGYKVLTHPHIISFTQMILIPTTPSPREKAKPILDEVVAMAGLKVAWPGRDGPGWAGGFQSGMN